MTDAHSLVIIAGYQDLAAARGDFATLAEGAREKTTFADHRLKSGLGDKIGQALSAGTAVVIAVAPAASRLAVEQALSSSPMKSVAELDESTLRGLEAALAETMGKFDPDRRKLPLPDRNFGRGGRTHDGRVDRRLDDRPRAEGTRGSAECLDRLRAPRGEAFPSSDQKVLRGQKHVLKCQEGTLGDDPSLVVIHRTTRRLV